MLDEAEFTIMGFIKGPVCRGQMALNVIEDHFWVVFLAPSSGARRSAVGPARARRQPAAPADGSSNTGLLVPWLHYAKFENDYLKAKSESLAQPRPGRRAPGPAPDLGRRRPQ